MKKILAICLALVASTGFAQSIVQSSGGGSVTASSVSSALYCEDAGGDDTYVCTLSPAITALTSLTFTMKVATGNTGAASVDVNGLGATAIKKAQGGVTTDPATNDIRAGAVIVLSYDGTNFQLQSTLGNAGAGTGDALVANPLSQFAATTSAQFAGVISDETGSGSVVLATSPTFVTPVLGAAAGTSLDLSGAATVEGGVNYCADAGSNDTYTCSLSPAITAYSTGTVYAFKANTANTGAASLNLNAIGAKTIVKTTGGVTTTLSDNDIRAGSVVQVAYDGTNLQLISPTANAASGGGITIGTTAITGGTATRILRESSGNVVTEDANLVNDGTTVTIGTGIGVAIPFTVKSNGNTLQTFVAASGRASFGYGINFSSNSTAIIPGGAFARIYFEGLSDDALGFASNSSDLWIGADGASGTAGRGVYLVGYNGSAWTPSIGVENVSSGGTKFVADATITAGGTTGAQTINKIAGVVNFAAAATTLVVTNSLAGTSSIILTTAMANDATCAVKDVERAAGSFTIRMTAACTAETPVGFLVINNRS